MCVHSVSVCAELKFISGLQSRDKRLLTTLRDKHVALAQTLSPTMRNESQEKMWETHTYTHTLDCKKPPNNVFKSRTVCHTQYKMAVHRFIKILH